MEIYNNDYKPIRCYKTAFKAKEKVDFLTANLENSDNNKLIINTSTSSQRVENHHNEETITNKEDILCRKLRRSKRESTGRIYNCSECKKSYLSYPALYTHKRNKHNIIPITGKPDTFRPGNTNTHNKFKYNLIATKTDVKGITDRIMKQYLGTAKRFYLDQNCVLRNPNYKEDKDQFLNILKYYNSSNIEKIRIPRINEKEKIQIHNILAIYLIILTEVTRDKTFFELIVKFVFLFREFLNLTGWDYLKHLQEFSLTGDVSIAGEFCSFSTCEEIPEMTNDFVLVFLEMDEALSMEKKEITDITQNFCSWLFITGLTNYKLTKL